MDNNITQAGSFQKPVHPIVFMFLILPFGILTGYISVTLAYLFSKAGISIEQVAGLVAASLIPQIFKFLWAPLVDTTLTVKKWYVLSTALSAACIFATALVPIKASNLLFITAIIILSNFIVSFVAMAANTFAAHDTPEHLKGRVSGYMQAGNMGGTGVGGGAGLWLAQHMPSVWMSGAVLAISCLLCCTALFFVKEPGATTVKVKSFAISLNNVVQDVWQLIKAKAGIIILILFLLPIGTCSAMNLFAAVARDWKTSADVVALVTGVVGGLITGVGSLIGGWLCDLMDRKRAYILFGLLQAACAISMALCPHTQVMYIVWTLIYSVTAGLAYAGFNAAGLEAIGKGAAATKFELLASISNAPIYLMTAILGIAYTRWGANGMLNTEAVCGCAGVVFFLILQAVINRKSKVEYAT